MKVKDQNASKKSKKPRISIVMYVAASVVALVGVALLVNNVILFTTAVTQYVAQGYAAATVRKQLIPAQLIPGVCEPIAIYGGIAFVLFGAAKIYEKISNCLILLTKEEACNDAIVETIPEQNVVEVENTEATEETEILGEV